VQTLAAYEGDTNKI